MLITFLNVSFSGLVTSAGEERTVFSCMITRNFVISVERNFVFLWVLMIGCVSVLHCTLLRCYVVSVYHCTYRPYTAHVTIFLKSTTLRFVVGIRVLGL